MHVIVESIGEDDDAQCALAAAAAADFNDTRYTYVAAELLTIRP